MSWFIKLSKKHTGLAAILIVLGVMISLLYWYISPIFGNQFCTMLSCGRESVRIVLVGQKPENYTVEVKFPSGKRSVTCTPDIIPIDEGEDWDSFGLIGDFCWSKGATFGQFDSKGLRDKPPRKLVVTVIFDGKRITKTFYPIYIIDHPNGKDCEPMCYYTTIKFNLSE